MSERLKVAVIGIGSMGANHARVYANRDDVDLVGVCDSKPEAVARLSHRHRVPGFSSIEELLEKAKPDAVTVAVPTSLHRSVAETVLKAGVHLLLEKPIATTVDEGREIVALAREHGVQLMIGHIERYNPAVQELRSRLQAGELGEVYRVEVDRVGPFPARIFDVGVTLDLAVHDLDIISSLLGAQPTRLYCQSQQLLHQNHEDAMIGLLDYPGGVLAVLNINWTSPVKRRQLRVYGRKGMFSVDYLTQDLYLYENPAQRDTEMGWGPLGIAEGNTVKFHLPKQEPLAREVDFFLDAIRKKSNLNETVESSLAALKLSQMLVQSAQMRTSLDVAP
jgi:UDP-N-acetylglucosamine 3-dehydrogenase